jgi:hypothetical protein
MAELPKTWDEWIENFAEWQDRVGYDREWLGDFDLSILFDWDRAGDTIEFGDYEELVVLSPIYFDPHNLQIQ